MGVPGVPGLEPKYQKFEEVVTRFYQETLHPEPYTLNPGPRTLNSEP